MEAFGALVFSGLVYSGGGVVYATRRPDPWPSVFGYHEVFHGLVMIATFFPGPHQIQPSQNSRLLLHIRPLQRRDK